MNVCMRKKYLVPAHSDFNLPKHKHHDTEMAMTRINDPTYNTYIQITDNIYLVQNCTLQQTEAISAQRMFQSTIFTGRKDWAMGIWFPSCDWVWLAGQTTCRCICTDKHEHHYFLVLLSAQESKKHNTGSIESSQGLKHNTRIDMMHSS